MPFMLGSTTASTAAAVTAASIALPPSWSTRNPAADASDWLVAIMPCRPTAGERVPRMLPAGRSPGWICWADEVDMIRKAPASATTGAHIASIAGVIVSETDAEFPCQRCQAPLQVRDVARAVGTNVRRKDGDAKVTGAAKYIDDLHFPGHAVRRDDSLDHSARPHCRRHCRSPDPGFVTADHRDIPGKNYVALIETDQPCLAVDEVRHVAEPVLLVAHAEQQALIDVEKHDHDRLRGTGAELRSRGIGPVLQAHRHRQGRPRSRLSEADVVIEGEYRTAHQEQLYIETNGVIAVPGDGQMTVYGSLQCPYYVHKALVVLLGLPRRPRARRPDRDRRRLRRQGRVPVDARVPRGDPGAQGRAAR